MTYDRESYGERSRDRLGEDSVGGEIEEEPNELDQPEGLEDDDLEEDELGIEGEELDDEGEASEDDDGEEPASPLAEDAPPRGRKKAEELEEEERGYALAASIEDEDDIEDSPGVRTSGGTDVAVMNQSDRRREFPTVARDRRGPGKRKESRGPAAGRRGGRRKPART